MVSCSLGFQPENGNPAIIDASYWLTSWKLGDAVSGHLFADPQPMARCLISFGANLGNARDTIRQAALELEQALHCQPASFQLSRFFRTPPVGGPAGQPPFVNAVAALSTDRSAWEVWAAVRQLEQQFGRQRNRRWEARNLDLDILLYDDLRIWTAQLKIPHPRLCMRRFILAPACDVAQDWVEPVTGMTIGALALALQNSPANLVLAAPNTLAANSILEEAARLSLSEWRFPKDCVDQAHCHKARWVTLASVENVARIASAKLCVVMAPPIADDGAAWEDCHRELAVALNLAPGPVTKPWSIAGPRYLLACDDRDWAIHELVAALEAMDCPVEPID